MAYETNRGVLDRSAGQAAVYDVGLRAHMLRVYNYMTAGLVITGLVAYATANTPALFNVIFGTPLMWVVMLAPLGFVFFLSFKIHSMRFSTAQTLFWIYAAVMGLSLATIFAVFTGASIARVFFITAGAFAGLSLFGYTTRKDLSGFGSFLFVGLIGLILAMLVNVFLESSALQFAVSVIGVLIFAGLTAYDTQQIKEMYSERHDSETSGKLAIMGALRLYLDFINLFVMLMHLFGERR